MKTNKHAWLLTDIQKSTNGVTVFTTFACGGGSSMGYKRAGCDVIGANDIDPEMERHYRKNLNPKHFFLCPIRDLISANLPNEFHNLDILDGSPPCSTFSISGSREKSWGKEKYFREGQSKQILSDLFFDYLDLADKLRPRVIVAENVKGIVLGRAKGYTKMIMQRLKNIGYRPQLFLINAANCGVPQLRERVFFCAIRADIKAPALRINPRAELVTCGEACSDIQSLTAEEIAATVPTKIDLRFWGKTMPGKAYTSACEADTGRNSFFNHIRLNAKTPAPTLCANESNYTHWAECRTLTFREWKRLGSFPDDYQAESERIGKYMIGMSVPPKMAEIVASAVIDQWLA